MPTRFLAGDRYRMEPVRNAKVFQSTPTSFLAGDSAHPSPCHTTQESALRANLRGGLLTTKVLSTRG